MAIDNIVNNFVNFHKGQLQSIPEKLWEKLYNKLKSEKFDAGEVFELHLGEVKDKYTLHLKKGACLMAQSDIFLIDHSWTTHPENAANELLNTPGLLDRMENLFNIKNKEESERKEREEKETEKEKQEQKEKEEQMEKNKEVIQLVMDQAHVTYERAVDALERHNYELINTIAELTLNEEYHSETLQNIKAAITGQIPEGTKSKEEEDNEKPKPQPLTIQKRIDRIVQYDMWEYIRFYQYVVLTDGEQESIISWYFLDEVGNAIQHSSDPNVVLIPFIFNNGAENIPYTLLYPIKNICAGEIITENKIPADIKEAEKKAYLMGLVDEPFKSYSKECEMLINNTKKWKSKAVNIPYVLQAPKFVAPLEEHIAEDSKLKVFTDLASINFNLKDKSVEFVKDVNDADVIWIDGEVEQFITGQIISRLPNQICVTNPLYLKTLIYQAYGNNNTILPESYDIMTELSEFVGSYLSIEQEMKANEGTDKYNPLSNFWIIKPVFTNNGQSKPSQWSITNSLSKIIRQRDTKFNLVVERYNNGKRPSLYAKQKYQLRFIVVLSSTSQGLAVYAYDENYVVYLANQFWSDKLEKIQNKDIHCVKYKDIHQNTPQNFIHHSKLEKCLEEEQHCSWSELKEKIYKNIKDVFTAAMSSPEPLGFSTIYKTLPAFFSVYAVDVELTEDLLPSIVNIEYLPDGDVMSDFDPDFLSKVLGRVTNGRVGDPEKFKKAFVQL